MLANCSACLFSANLWKGAPLSGGHWWCQQVHTSRVQGGPKIGTVLLNSLTLSNINRFSKCFHCQNQEKICNKSSLKIPPHLKCIVTLAYLVKCQRLKSNNWKQDDFCNNTFLGHRVYTMPSDICYDFAAGLSVRVPGCQKLQMTA